MKVSIDLNGASGKMWEFDMKYHNLSPEYIVEVAASARAYANYLKNLAGGAAADDPKYTFRFAYDTEGKGPKVPEYEELFKGEVRAQNLLYSQAVEAQEAGIKLLQNLLIGAHMEIASGQRK